MMQFGASPSQAREMNLDDIFLLRLKLLLCMAKDCLDDRDFSDLRRQVMLENALHIETESMEMGFAGKDDDFSLNEQTLVNFDDIFFQCTKDLCVMIKSAANGDPMDERKKKALQKKTSAIICILGTKDHRRLAASFHYCEATV